MDLGSKQDRRFKCEKQRDALHRGGNHPRAHDSLDRIAAPMLGVSIHAPVMGATLSI